METLNLSRLPYGRSKAETNDLFFLAAPEPGHQQNTCLDSCITQRNRFIKRSHTEPLRPLFFERPRTLHGTMPVGISLHHRANRHIYAYMALYYSEVVAKIVKRNLSPGRTRRRALNDFDGGHLKRL